MPKAGCLTLNRLLRFVTVLVVGTWVPCSVQAQVGIDDSNEPLLNEVVTKTKVPPPVVGVKTVDHYGKVRSWTAKVTSRWNWVSKSPRSESGQPAIEIRWESQPGLSREFTNRDFKPYRFTGLDVWGSLASSDSLKVGLTTDRILTQVIAEDIALFFTLQPTQTWIDVDSSCVDMGIRFTRTAKAPNELLYLAFRCESLSQGRVQVTTFLPSDSSLIPTALLQKGTIAPGVIQWTFTRQQAPVKRRRYSLGKIQIAGSETVIQVIRDRPKESRISGFFKGWNSNVAIGPSLLLYSEQPDSEKLTILGITGKVATQTVVVPDKFDFAINAFGTLLPLTMAATPSDLVAKRFFGLNLRGGVMFPGEARAIRWSLSFGWYFWGMIGSDSRYGINLLSGPQIFLVGRKALPGDHGVFGYFKLAPITDSMTNLSLGNREVALGAGYSWKTLDRTWGLTLDAAALTFSVLDAENAISLNSINLGLQMGL